MSSTDENTPELNNLERVQTEYISFMKEYTKKNDKLHQKYVADLQAILTDLKSDLNRILSKRV
jgi:hypothetical protein